MYFWLKKCSLETVHNLAEQLKLYSRCVLSLTSGSIWSVVSSWASSAASAEHRPDSRTDNTWERTWGERDSVKHTVSRHTEGETSSHMSLTWTGLEPQRPEKRWGSRFHRSEPSAEEPRSALRWLFHDRTPERAADDMCRVTRDIIQKISNESSESLPHKNTGHVHTASFQEWQPHLMREWVP